MKRIFLLLLLASPICAQNNFGELRLKITDPAGAGVKLSAQFDCEANEFQETLWSDESGTLVAKGLPFGVYRVQIRYPGFAPYSTFFEVRSILPVEYAIRLTLASLNSAVNLSAGANLVQRDSFLLRLQGDVENLNDRLNLINFAGLFSGNAIAPPRSYSLRLTTSF